MYAKNRIKKSFLPKDKPQFSRTTHCISSMEGALECFKLGNSFSYALIYVSSDHWYFDNPKLPKGAYTCEQTRSISLKSTKWKIAATVERSLSIAVFSNRVVALQMLCIQIVEKCIEVELFSIFGTAFLQNDKPQSLY